MYIYIHVLNFVRRKYEILTDRCIIRQISSDIILQIPSLNFIRRSKAETFRFRFVLNYPGPIVSPILFFFFFRNTILVHVVCREFIRKIIRREEGIYHFVIKFIQFSIVTIRFANKPFLLSRRRIIIAF